MSSACRGFSRTVSRSRASFAVFQTNQEGETRLFATGRLRDRLEILGQRLKIRDKLVLLDTFAVPSLLATPL